MIKVMYVANEEILGGASLSLLDLLEGLCLYIEPVVILPGHGELEHYYKVKKIKYYVVPFVPGYGKKENKRIDTVDIDFLDNYSAAMRVKNIAEEEKIQLIHSNSSTSNVGALAAAMLGIPHVWHIRELIEEQFGCEFWNDELKKELISYADAVISISECVKNGIREKYNIDSVCIYDGMNIKKYYINIDNAPLSRSFLLAGAIISEKGQLEAVKAVEVLINDGENVVLRLVGKEDERFGWMLRRYIKNRNLEDYIEILPFQADLKELRRNSGFAIIASKKEALGRVTIEAMLAGNVVIGADTGATPELIGDNHERGYLYRQGNYMDLARVIKEAVSDSKNCFHKIEKLRRRAQDFVVKNCSTENYAERILWIYGNAIKNHSKKSVVEANDFRKRLAEQYEQLKNVSIKYDKQLCEGKLIQTKIQQWERAARQKDIILDYFWQNKGETVAIYGMGYMGYKVYDCLEKIGINISYVIDKKTKFWEGVLDIYTPEDILPEVGVIIVTVLREEESIKLFLQQKCPNSRIFGISQIINMVVSQEKSTAKNN